MDTMPPVTSVLWLRNQHTVKPRNLPHNIQDCRQTPYTYSESQVASACIDMFVCLANLGEREIDDMLI